MDIRVSIRERMAERDWRRAQGEDVPLRELFAWADRAVFEESKEAFDEALEESLAEDALEESSAKDA